MKTQFLIQTLAIAITFLTQISAAMAGTSTELYKNHDEFRTIMPNRALASTPQLVQKLQKLYTSVVESKRCT